MQFSHLHNHSQFSLLDGATPIASMFKKAMKDEMPAVAITDHGNMFGAFQFVAQAWKETKVVGKDKDGKDIKEPVVKPIVGCEFYVVADRHVRAFTKEVKDKRYHQLFLAKNEIGYKNLVKLCSLGFMEGLYGKYPRIDKELIAQYSEGLIATTCCLGASVPQAILQHGEAAAELEFKWWLDLFGDDYYVEFQRHGIPEQETVNNILIKFSEKYNVPMIASNDSHYLDKSDANAHDILLCLNTGEKQATPSNKDFADDDAQRPKNTRFAFYNDEFYFKTTDEMTRLFHDLPQAIENTQLIVEKVKPLKLEKDIMLPNFVVPADFNEDQDAYLYHLTWKGARERYQEITPEIEERINFELFTIKTMGFAGYFLIVADFIQAGRDLGVFVGPGRGSAAGSVVAYCISITNIDPIKYQLLFERFLNPDRKSMPDIDTDFDDAGRQKVIDYVVDKYGKQQVAHIVTYGTMAAKMSIKDVARVLDLPLAQANTLAKLVPDKPGISLRRVLTAPIEKAENGVKSLKEKEDLREEDLINVRKLREFLDSDLQESEVLKEALKLEGSVRNTGIHAAGIIIAPSDLSDLLPVAAVKDVQLLITQFDGSVIENAGVIKMDFLGLKTLSIIKDALKLIKRNHGVSIVIDDIPLDDVTTFELYQRGDTNGTFQFESPGMQKHLRDLKPDVFADLIAMNALYRPGPIQYIPNFIRRKHGKEEIVYDLPEMEEYLSDTYGITVYQEQVMLLSQKIAGFSKGDADVLRKAMGKKQIEVLNKMKKQFMDGATALGHPADKLEKIWTDWEAFAQYAFNKSHSTCYAFVAFQTAYLKAHYPAEYMAAVLNNTKATEKITFFMEECKRMGLTVLGPDVNESLKEFAVTNEGVIRFGLSAIKGVGDAAMEELVQEREAKGAYTSVFDIVMRNSRAVNKKSLEAMVMGGAMDSFTDVHRGQLLSPIPDGNYSNALELITKFGAQYHDQKDSMSNSLFGEASFPEVTLPTLPKVEEWSLHDLLYKEKEVLGFYLSAHPLDEYKFEMTHYGIIPCNRITELMNRKIRIAGFITESFHGITKKGDGWGRMTINDYTGNYQVSFWREDYVRYKDFIENDSKVVLEGTYKEHPYRKGEFEFKIADIYMLSRVPEKLTTCLNVEVYIQKMDDADLQQLLYVTRTFNGKVKINLSIVDTDQERRLVLSQDSGKGITVNEEVVKHLSQMKNINYGIEYLPI